MAASERRDWGQTVIRQLLEEFRDVAGTTFEIHAGARYVSAIRDELHAMGGMVVVPTAGLGLGRQLARYGSALAVQTDV